MKCNIMSLWDTHRQFIESYIRRRIKDEEAAKDLVQDVLLKFCQYCKLNNNLRNNKNWLFKITRNVIADHFCREQKKEKLKQGLPTSELPEENDPYLNSEYLALFINQLPEKYRLPLLWSEIELIPQAEIAKKLNISLSGAKSRVQRARLQLKGLLMQCCQLERDHRGGITSCIPKATCPHLQGQPDSFSQVW